MGAPEGAAAIGGPVAAEAISVASDKSLPQTGRTNGWKDGLIQFKDENETHTAHLETRTQCDRFLGCILGVPKVTDTGQEWMGVGSGEEDNDIDSSSIAFIKNAFKNLLFIFDNTLIISTPCFPPIPHREYPNTSSSPPSLCLFLFIYRFGNPLTLISAAVQGTSVMVTSP